MVISFSVDLDRDIILANWGEKSFQVEKEMHEAGGVFQDFNVYRFPLTVTHLKRAVRTARQLGKVKYTPEAKQTFQNLLDKERTMKELSGGDADAEVPPLLLKEYPETAKALRPYQRAAVKFIATNEYTLLADDPGAGKTLSTISALISAGVTGDILVLSPSIATQVTWPNEIKKWAPNEEIVQVTGTRTKREAQLAKLRFFPGKGKRRWVLCNLEMVKTKYHKQVVIDGVAHKAHYEYQYPELFFIDYWEKRKNPRKWAAIVVDESHRALITDQTQSYKQTQIRCGFGKLQVEEGGKKIAISGTPFRGKLQNLWGTLNWLSPAKFKAYWPWVQEWFATESKYFGGTEILDLQGQRRKEFFESFAPFTLRRTKAEIATELPPKTYAGTLPENFDGDMTEQERRGLIGHWLDMEPKQKRAYDQMVEEALAHLDSGTLMANGPLAEMTRLKQFAGCYGTLETKVDSDGLEFDVFKPALPSNKFNWLLEFLDELGISKEIDSSPEARKVVVASQFTSVINLFEQALNKRGIKTLKVTGGVSGKERSRAQEEFQQDGGPQVFLLNTIAGGVSLTLDRADDIVILDETFIPDDQEQVEDRVHRVSRNHNVTIHYVRSKGTIEERIAKLTFGRDLAQKEVLDGERGVQFVRQILVKE